MFTSKQHIINFISRLISKLKTSYKISLSLVKQSLPKHAYKVLSIEQDEENNFIAVIQVTNKGQVFRMQPEEILAKDSLTDSFSQRDIRTLTYLGYLGINSPKYKILAKRLSENDTKLLFAIKERGTKKTIIKTAHEISTDENLLTNLHQQDAHMIGYTVASEQILLEQVQKQKLQNTKETHK